MNKLRMLRVFLGKTQKKLADDMGVEQYLISKWERMDSIPQHKSLTKLNTVFSEALQQTGIAPFSSNDFKNHS